MNIRIFALCLLFLIGVIPGIVIAGESGTNNVIILLDTSGSMNDPMPGTGIRKMTVAQEALATVMNQISPDTHVGLLVFSSVNRPDDWVYPLGPLDMPRLTEALSSLTPGGNTPLGIYIKKAADRLLEERQKNFGYGTYKLLIVTDGEAQDRILVDRYTPDVISRGITMDVIGVAMKQDHTLATHVHSYRRADDPQALTQALIQVFAEVGGKDSGNENDEGFDELAAIPEGMASSLITALASSGNNPIGGVSLNKTVTEPSKNQPPPPTPPPTKTKNPSPFSSYVWIAVAIGVLLMFRRGKKRRRR